MSENYDLLVSYRWQYSCLKNGNIWSSQKGDLFIVPDFNLLSPREREAVYEMVLESNKMICDKLGHFIKEENLDIAMKSFPEVDFTPLGFCELVKHEVDRKKKGKPLMKRIRGDVANQLSFKYQCESVMNETIGQEIDKQFADLTKKPKYSFAEKELHVLPKKEKEAVL